jgi:RNA polymerase sigma-70 factor, ECF subfamily
MDPDLQMELLMMAAKSGDAEAFMKLMDWQKANLYRIAQAFLNNEQDTFDALQETSFRAYRGIAKLKDKALFETWLTRILLNCCNDEYRRRKRRGLFAQLKIIVSSQPSFSGESDLKITLEEAIRELPANQKEIIILKYIQQYTLTEIAVILGCPEGTVKTRLHKALGRLRGTLGREVLANG